MFFIRYLWHELRRRMHQAVFIALGLAVGIGLVITVSSASAGVNKAESGVLSALYGLGTNVTATGPAVLAGRFGRTTIRSGPNGGGVEACQNGRCENAAGQTVQNLAPQYSPVTSAEVAAVARLHDVSAAADGLLLTDAETTFPPNYGRPGGPARLRALLDSGQTIVAPGAFDPLSARLVEEAGFPAVYMTGFGTSAALIGRPDVGLLTMTEMVGNAGRIAACVDVPVIADADTGYGNPLNVIRTVGAYEAAGVAGIHIEDQVAPK